MEYCRRRKQNACERIEDYEMQKVQSYSKPCLVQKEMGLHRRKRRSLHGRDVLCKFHHASVTELSSATFHASCLEISEESILETIMEDCASVEDMIKKLKEQTISLTKKRCIKTKLKPVRESKALKLGLIKKLKYRLGISYGKLKIGFRNFLYTCELWYSSLKMIEGKFGSSVATYFKFLRKLFILNCIIFLINFFFIILPQIFYLEFSNIILTDSNRSIHYKEKNISLGNFKVSDDQPDINSIGDLSSLFFLDYNDTQTSSLRLGNLFTGMGYLTESVLFYGFYFNTSFSLSSNFAYDIPSAYFFSNLCCYFLVLWVLFFSTEVFLLGSLIFYSVAESYKKNYIETANGVKNVFAEKIFCGWDFGITKSDAEELKYSSIYMELKELLNESICQKERANLLDRLYTLIARVTLNLILLLLFFVLGWAISIYLDIHMDSTDIPKIMMLMLTITLITTLAPVTFSWLERIEFYDCPRTALYVTLIRTFLLHILIVIMIVAHRINTASKISCWETVVGQDIYRLIVLDFIVGVAENMIEFIRSRMNKIWKIIRRPEFNIALNTMNLIYNQALLYVGLYFSPALSLIVSLKMLLTFYIKKWGAMYNCQPSQKPWRPAQMQTVFLSFAFLVIFGVIIGLVYIFTSVKTSSCGPFGGGKYVFEAGLFEMFQEGMNSSVVSLISHFLRSGVVVIMLLVMVLAIYYLRTVNSVRRRILKNLRCIIKEQVIHKKELLAKIQRAEEDFRNSSKNNTRDFIMQNHSVTNLCVHKPGNNSSDSDDPGEDIPLQVKYRSLQSNKYERKTYKAWKSSYNLAKTENLFSDKSRKKTGTSTSLQNLNFEGHFMKISGTSHIKGECSKELDFQKKDITINRRVNSPDDRLPSRMYFGPDNYKLSH